MDFRHSTAGLLLAAGFTAASVSPGYAQESVPQPTGVTPDVVKYASDLHLAYIRTSDTGVNNDAQEGLTALAVALVQKTSVEPKGVVGLDIENDSLAFFPFIYWPVTSDARALSVAAQKKVQDYINAGGVILFDVRDQSVDLSGENPLRRLLSGISLNPLVRMSEDGALTKSFYLVSRLPGSSNGTTIWIEAPLSGDGNDITSVIIGQENWAAAWRGRTVPQGSEAHEDALKSGINMVLPALTGTYKNDPIHQEQINYKREMKAKDDGLNPNP